MCLKLRGSIGQEGKNYAVNYCFWHIRVAAGLSRTELMILSMCATSAQKALAYTGHNATYRTLMSHNVVRTHAPVDQDLILQEWCTCDHLSAIGVMSPGGKFYCHSQDRAINSDGMVGILAQ